MRGFKYLILTIVSVALSGCAGSPGPGSASASRPAGPAWPAWMGDVYKTDVTPADRAERLRALKTDESKLLTFLQKTDWTARNCQTGAIRIAHTALWRQEIAVAKKNKASQARLDAIEKGLNGRVKLMGGMGKTCQLYFRSYGHQDKLFINVSGLPA